MTIGSRRMRLGAISGMLLCAMVLSSCGDDAGSDQAAGQPPAAGPGGAAGDQGSGGDGGGSVQGPCDLTEPSVVGEVFGGTVDGEEPGAVRSCKYAVKGGPVDEVIVYYYGTKDFWSGIRSGYEDNRGPLTAVSGVGDEAFHPADAGPLEIVVLAGEVAFAVGLGGSKATGDVPAKVKELATRIAGAVG